jgi:basic amino acid/polyamine antiporter, APA family
MNSLKRTLNLRSVVAISIAGMLGSGIFVLPGIAAAKTGSSIWLAYLCAAILIIPAALSKSELATAIPKSGGAYVYIERSFGPILGTIAGLGLWGSLLLKSSFALVGLGAYFTVLFNFPSLDIRYVSIIFLIIIVLLNILGVKKVGKVQLVIVLLSLIGLSSILILGYTESNLTTGNSFLLDGNYGLVSTIAFVYMSYAGVTKVAAIAGEVKKPEINLPIAMIGSLIIIALIYISISYTLVEHISISNLKNDTKPLYTLAETLGGSTFAFIIAIVGVITLFSMANSGMLATSRFPFAMSVDNLLPKKLSVVHYKYLTPINTILLTSFIMVIIILKVDVIKIVKLASAFKVLMFILVNMSVIILRETAVQWYKPSYHSPMYPYVQIFGIISGVILLFYLGLMPFIVLVGVSIIGVIIYFIFGKKSSRSGVLSRYVQHSVFSFLFKNNTRLNNDSLITEEKTTIQIHESINHEAEVIIPLLGDEISPLDIIDIGTGLNSSNHLQVLNITEVPDQTSTEIFEGDTPKNRALYRLVKNHSESNNTKSSFKAIATHNLQETISVISTLSKVNWLVLGWDGRSYNGIFFKNPLGWILNHINSNFALYKCNGTQSISKILLSIRHDSLDYDEIILTTKNIAKHFNTKFTMIHIVPNNSSERMMENIKNKANNKLKETESEILIVKTETPLEYISDISAEYDLLIIGTPRKDSWKDVLFGTGKDLFALHANCSVLRLTFKAEK